MTSKDHARVLLGKARDDEVAVRKFADDPDIADAVVGFHAHQGSRRRSRPFSLPEELSDDRRLTPWAAEFRYGETIDERLDRSSTTSIVQGIVRWAESHVEGGGA